MMTLKGLTILLFGCLTASGAELSEVHTVYLFPMVNAFDQYLAQRLTNSQVFRVVADPKRAEAVFTDRLGEVFEQRLRELYPDATEKTGEDPEAEQLKSQDKQLRSTSFGRGKGTLFLVDARSRQVLWSIYEVPKNIHPQQLERSAGRIVARLKKDLSGK